MDREIPSSERLRQRAASLLRPMATVLVIAAAGFWGLGLLRPGMDRDRFRTATVERGPLEAVIVAAGTVQPAADRVITSPVAARLLKVWRRPGSRVQPGDAILELDLSASELALDQLAGRIERGVSSREELRLELEVARIDLSNQLQIKELEREELDFELEQKRRLHSEGLLSESELRRIETRGRRLQIELKGLEASLAKSEKSAQAKLDGADSELRSLRDEHAQLARELERASTRAEQAGVITWVLDDEGARVAPGDELARLADLGSFRVEASASDVHSSRLQVGLPVRIPLNRDRGSDGLVLDGRIDRVLPSVEEGAVRFWVELENTHAASEILRPNLRLDVLVVLERKSDVLTVDKGAFARGPGVHEVFVLTPDGSRAVRRTIELGLSGYDAWEVLSGLDAGDVVVTSDVSDLKHLADWRVR